LPRKKKIFQNFQRDNQFYWSTNEIKTEGDKKQKTNVFNLKGVVNPRRGSGQPKFI